jgi:hypothetical protein
MRLTGLAVSLLFGASLAGPIGCADGDAEDGGARRWDDVTSERKPGSVAADGSCVPATCQTLTKTSGRHPDGCGGTLDCGGTAEVKDDVCTDAKPGNGTKETAADLGAMEDGGDLYNASTEKVVSDLTLADGAEDWFRLKVADVGFDGNPRITVAAPNAEVSIFYVCDAKGDDSVCPNAVDTADDLIGKGCRGKATVALKAYCDTWDESGTAFIRVKKAAADNQCMTYALTINVY